MKIECENCRSPVSVSDDLLGKRIRCPRCQKPTRVEPPRRRPAVRRNDLGRAWITVEAGFRPGTEYDLTGESSVIGRAENSDIPLFGDRSVDKAHARIVRRADGYYLIDEGSAGGTFLNDVPLKTTKLLESGDRISVGSAVLCFSMDEPQERPRPADFETGRSASRKRASRLAWFMAGLAVGLVLTSSAGAIWLFVFAREGDKKADQPVAAREPKAGEPKKDQNRDRNTKVDDPNAGKKKPADDGKDLEGKQFAFLDKKNRDLDKKLPIDDQKINDKKINDKKIDDKKIDDKKIDDKKIDDKKIDDKKIDDKKIDDKLALLDPKNDKGLPAPADKERLMLVGQFGHADTIQGLAISDDGRLMATGGWDKTARVWDLPSGKELRVFPGHTIAVNSLALSGDGKWLVTCANFFGNSAYLWHVPTGKKVKEFNSTAGSVKNVALSSDGLWLFAGGQDSTARMWDVAAGKEVRVFEGHNAAAGVTGLAVSRDGKFLATHAQRENVILWNALTGEKLLELKNLYFDSCLALSADGKWLAVSDDETVIAVWDTQKRSKVHAFKGHLQRVRTATFSSDGKSLVTTSLDQSVRRWDLDTGKENVLVNGTDLGIFLRISGDNKTFVTADNNKRPLFDVYDLASGKLLRSFGRSVKPINALALALDGKSLALAVDNDVRMWSLEKGQELHAFRGHTGRINAVALTADGKWLVSGGQDKSVRLWNRANQQTVRTLDGEQVAVSSVVLAAGDKRLATGGYDKTARVWDLENGQLIREFKHPSAVLGLAFSQDGNSLAASLMVKSTYLWDVNTGKKIREFTHQQNFGYHAVVLTADGKSMFTGNGNAQVTHWNVDKGFAIRGYDTYHIGCPLALSADGQRLLISGIYQDAQLVQPFNKGKLVTRFKGDLNIDAVAITSDGKRIITGSRAGAGIVWDVETGKELCRFIHSESGDWAVYDDEGRYDTEGGKDVPGVHWVLGTDVLPLDRYKAERHDPGLLAKHLGLLPQPLKIALPLSR